MTSFYNENGKEIKLEDLSEKNKNFIIEKLRLVTDSLEKK